LAEDLANIKGTPFLDLPLGSVFLMDCQRADVIEVKPSYTRFCVSIYEVKISRSDFMSDIRSGKWRGYLEHCHRFYFAVSQGVAQKCDVPPEAGLIVRGETGWSTVKAAPARDVIVPDYTLMSMIFMKERFAHSGQHRERLKQLLGYSHSHDHLLKSLGKKLGDALRNYDEYQTSKSNFEYWKEEIKQAPRKEGNVNE
jgi:hypothetical protein